MANAAIGYNAKSLDSEAENYANVSKIIYSALTELGEDVRAARQIKVLHRPNKERSHAYSNHRRD